LKKTKRFRKLTVVMGIASSVFSSNNIVYDSKTQTTEYDEAASAKSALKSYLDLIQTQDQTKAHSAKAMVLSCMDFRLLDDIVYFMNHSGYNNNYDQFILAGSSLGATQEKYKSWSESWNEHLELAKTLHNVEEIICVDHEKCGAYKLFYPDITPETEKELHVKHLLKFEKQMKLKHPKLKVFSYYMHLDGTCEDCSTVKHDDKELFKTNELIKHKKIDDGVDEGVVIVADAEHTTD
jgi:carbonic anhydrase